MDCSRDTYFLIQKSLQIFCFLPYVSRTVSWVKMTKSFSPTSQVSPAYRGKGGRKPAKSSGSRHSLALRRRKLWHVVHGYLCEGPIILVGGFNHIEKYESQWGGLSHILIMEHKKCLKPPTRCKMNVVQSVSGLVRLNVFDISNNKITVFRLIPTLTNYSVIVWFLTYQLETYMECIF